MRALAEATLPKMAVERQRKLSKNISLDSGVLLPSKRQGPQLTFSARILDEMWKERAENEALTDVSLLMLVISHVHYLESGPFKCMQPDRWRRKSNWNQWRIRSLRLIWCKSNFRKEGELWFYEYAIKPFQLKYLITWMCAWSWFVTRFVNNYKN